MSSPTKTSKDEGATEAEAPGARVPQRVLVVDDFEDNREMYSEYLSFAGFEVDVAGDGEAAMKAVQDHPPDAILMDLSLPLIDGLEAIRLLKADGATEGIPILALTGHASAAQQERAREAGADDFATKPCLPGDVEQKLRQLLTRGSGSKR